MVRRLQKYLDAIVAESEIDPAQQTTIHAIYRQLRALNKAEMILLEKRLRENAHERERRLQKRVAQLEATVSALLAAQTAD